jgi:predicted ArsR family transcriptional regulator
MVAEGAIEAREPRVYGTRGRGRPAKVFAITDTGRERFDQQYDDLAVQALRYLEETGGEAAVLEFARRRVAAIETNYDEIVAVEPGLAPSQALARALTLGGYAASVRQGPVGEQLCQQHCPVSHVAHEFPQLCEAETEVISKVLGRHVQRLATIAHGDGVCTTCIPAARETSHQSPSQAHERLTS